MLNERLVVIENILLLGDLLMLSSVWRLKVAELGGWLSIALVNIESNISAETDL